MSELFHHQAHMPEIRPGDLVTAYLWRRRVDSDEDALWWNTASWARPSRIERDGRIIWRRA
jgi:hypothetical protein